MHETNVLGQNSENGLFKLYDQRKGWNKTWGFQSIQYDSNKDPIEKVDSIIQIWKKTALHHEFKTPVLTQLSCLPSEEGHVLTYPLVNGKESDCKSIHCKVENIDASADITEDINLSNVRLNISGKNIETGNNFDFNLHLYLTPKKYVNNDSMYYKEDKKYTSWEPPFLS